MYVQDKLNDYGFSTCLSREYKSPIITSFTHIVSELGIPGLTMSSLSCPPLRQRPTAGVPVVPTHIYRCGLHARKMYTLAVTPTSHPHPRARGMGGMRLLRVCAHVFTTRPAGGGGHLLVSSGPDTAIVISGRCDRVIVDYGCSTAAFTPCSLHTKHTRRAYAYKHTHPCPFRPSSVY